MYNWKKDSEPNRNNRHTTEHGVVTYESGACEITKKLLDESEGA